MQNAFPKYFENKRPSTEFFLVHRTDEALQEIERDFNKIKQSELESIDWTNPCGSDILNHIVEGHLNPAEVDGVGLLYLWMHTLDCTEYYDELKDTESLNLYPKDDICEALRFSILNYTTYSKQA